LNKATDETAEPILTRNISKRVSPWEVSVFGSKQTFTILGVIIPKIALNIYFAAKYAKSWNSHISVIDEAIRVRFDRQIDSGEKYPKSAT